MCMCVLCVLCECVCMCVLCECAVCAVFFYSFFYSFFVNFFIFIYIYFLFIFLNLGGTLSYCLYKIDSISDLEFGFFYYPFIAITFIGSLFLTAVNVEVVRSNRFTKNIWRHPDMKSMYTFCSIFLIFTISLLVLRLYALLYQDRLKQSLTDYVTCVFTQYSKSDPNGYKSICGTAANFRLNFSFSSWVLVQVSGVSILISVVFLCHNYLHCYSISDRVGVVEGVEIEKNHADTDCSRLERAEAYVSSNVPSQVVPNPMDNTGNNGNTGNTGNTGNNGNNGNSMRDDVVAWELNSHNDESSSRKKDPAPVKL